jgi:hypothetical protein
VDTIQELTGTIEGTSHVIVYAQRIAFEIVDFWCIAQTFYLQVSKAVIPTEAISKIFSKEKKAYLKVGIYVSVPLPEKV